MQFKKSTQRHSVSMMCGFHLEDDYISGFPPLHSLDSRIVQVQDVVELSADDGRAQTTVVFPINGHVNVLPDCKNM